MLRNFYDELNEDNFKKITYTIYNKMDDENYITYLEKKFNEVFSVEDFKYYDFDLTDKEKFLLKMHNKDYLNNVKILKKEISTDGIKVYVDFEEGIVRVVKLNKINLNGDYCL
jgi:hypothetical protein